MLVPLLVGGFNPSEKYEFVSWDDDIPNWMESLIKFHGSKPPTSYSFFFHLTDISPLAKWKNPMGVSLYIILHYSAMDPPPTGLPKPRIGAAHSYLTAMAIVSIPWGHGQVIG